MKRLRTAALAALLAIPGAACLADLAAAEAPQYKVEPFWPKPLPDNWILGQVAGIAVDNAGQHLDRAPARHAARRREGRAEKSA